MDEVLGTDKANEIISQCHDVRADWWHLGIRLGVLYSTLEAIEAGHKGDVTRCLSALISAWLKRAKGDVNKDVSPTWKSLCKALSYINGPLAEAIAREHGCGYINPIVSKVAGAPGADPPVFLPQSCGCGRCTVKGWVDLGPRVCQNVYNDKRPLLLVVDSKNPQATDLVRFDASYDRHFKLRSETSEIDNLFVSVRLETWMCLGNIDSHEVMKLGFKLSAWLGQPFPMISNIFELQAFMHSLGISWFNYEPLHFLAKESLDSGLISSWGNYIDCFIYYCLERNLKEYANVFFQTQLQNVFILEVDELYNKLTLSDIGYLRKSLSTALKFPLVGLHLVTVKTSSLFIYFNYGYSDYLIVFQSLSAQQLREIASIKCYRILSLVDFYDQFKYKNIQEYCCLEEAVPKSEEDLSTSDSSEEIKLTYEQLKKELDEHRTELHQCRVELKMYKKLSQNIDMQLSKKGTADNVTLPPLPPPHSILASPEGSAAIEDNSSSDTGSSDSHSGSSSHVNKKTNILLEGQYRTIAFDQKGLFYHSEDHGVTVIIPENAVKGPATIQFTASRLWPNFKCAKGSYEPVSPFVYICTKDKLSEPAQVDIPHYIDGDDKDNIVVLVKGHRKNAAFEVLENSKFQVNQTTACVEMKHFCVFCLAVAREGKPKKRRYHVLCAEKTTQYTKDVQICILYNPQCFKGTRKYYKSNGYTIKPADEIEGDICQKGISISDVQIPDGKWTWTEIGMINKKITEKNIDMFEVIECTPETLTEKHVKMMEEYENEGQYPPRFHLQFENTTHQATDQSCPVTITLTGFVSGDFSFKTVLGEQLDRQNPEEKDPLLIELMSYIEPILDDSKTYYQFGKQLGLTIDELNQLEYKFLDTGRHIMQMLLKWRDSSQSVSHHDISKALRTCGYPILSVIVENQFFYKYKTVDGGDYEVVDKGRQLNGYQIIAERLWSIDTGDSNPLLQKPSDVDFVKLVIQVIDSKWNLFARQVELDGNAVEAIKKDNNGICRDCFTAVLDKWKRRNSPSFTWETVLSVLYSDTVRGYKAGEHVYQHLMQSLTI